jgi:hypothetical protein
LKRSTLKIVEKWRKLVENDGKGWLTIRFLGINGYSIFRQTRMAVKWVPGSQAQETEEAQCLQDGKKLDPEVRWVWRKWLRYSPPMIQLWIPRIAQFREVSTGKWNSLKRLRISISATS